MAAIAGSSTTERHNSAHSPARDAENPALELESDIFAKVLLKQRLA